MRRFYDILLSKSRLTIGLIGFVLFLLMLGHGSWRRADAIRHDMTSYYGYLPATIIHHDLTLSYTNDPKFEGQYAWTNEVANGRIFRMTMGIAVMESPFFLMADTLVKLTGQERIAYSKPYYFFMYLGTLIYLCWGLFFLFKLLSERFSKQIAFATCVALVFGTNLYYYALDEAMMSHAFNFFLYAALLYQTIQWHRNPKMATALKMGLCIGLLALIRPIHILSVLIPLVYDGHLKTKWSLLAKHSLHVVWIALTAFFIAFPQLLYWKLLTGNWINYTYGDEHFFFNDPMIFKGLLGFRKGWLIYSPLLFLAFFGMRNYFKKDKSLGLIFISLIPLYIYVVFSWWCWWYGGSFGSRPMIDLLPLFAFPLAAFFSRLQAKLRFGGTVSFLLIALSIGLNIFQTRQYKSSLLHWDSTTWPLYKSIFLSKKWPQNYDELLSPPDYEAAKKGERDI